MSFLGFCFVYRGMMSSESLVDGVRREKTDDKTQTAGQSTKKVIGRLT